MLMTNTVKSIIKISKLSPSHFVYNIWSILVHFWYIFGPFLVNFGSTFSSFFFYFWPIFGLFLVHFESFLVKYDRFQLIWFDFDPFFVQIKIKGVLFVEDVYVESQVPMLEFN